MDENFLKMLEAIDKHELRCEVCKYQYDGCEGGVAGGPNGPIYPPCCDMEPQSYIDEDLLRELYEEMRDGA